MSQLTKRLWREIERNHRPEMIEKRCQWKSWLEFTEVLESPAYRETDQRSPVIAVEL